MKGFVHIRIDDRLIHGQVATRWSTGLKVNRIMVIDDAVAANDNEKAIKNGNYDGQRVMLIVKSPVTLVKMMEMGVELLPVNIGNMSNRPGTTQYKKSVSMFPEEKAAVDTLLSAGIKVTAQMVPDDPSVGIETFF